MPRARSSLTLFFSLLIASCAGGAGPSLPEPRPLGGDLPEYRVPGEGEPNSPAPALPAPQGELTLRQALAAALLGSPALSAASLQIRAAEARALTASLLPNPELEFEVEEFGGSGELSGFKAAELVLSLSQEIPLSGRVGKGMEVARIEGRLTGWDLEATRLDVLTETTKAFVAVVAAQERTKLAEESVRLADEVASAVRLQVDAGKVSPLEANRARVDVSREKLRVERERRNLEVARRELAALWGASDPSFTLAAADLFAVRPVPPADALEVHLSESPEFRRLDEELELRAAKLRSERALAWPDLTLTGGVKRIEELDLHAYLAGISIPLPIFDRNQGGVDEARVGILIAEQSRRAGEVRLRTGFFSAWQALDAAAKEAATLARSVLPAARGTFEASRDALREGKLGYLEVLLAQRTLFETREQQIDALEAYHLAVADVERLIGRALEDAGNETPRENREAN
jgi:cobalt-zinc-cadmium efflux system outer membrane protein